MLTLPQLVIILGLIFIMSELFIGINAGFDLVLIGSCLVLGGIFGLITGNTVLAAIVAVGLSLVYLLFGRSFIKKKMTNFSKKTNVDKLVGTTGVCVRSISPAAAGMVRLDDEDWRASADQLIAKNDTVEVVSVNGVTLKVKLVNKK